VTVTHTATKKNHARTAGVGQLAFTP
jgi:hypothetical protein